MTHAHALLLQRGIFRFGFCERQPTPAREAIASGYPFPIPCTSEPGRGAVKVSGTIDGCPFLSSFMAMGDGKHMLPVKIEIRREISEEAGQMVRVVLKKWIRL